MVVAKSNLTFKKCTVSWISLRFIDTKSGDRGVTAKEARSCHAKHQRAIAQEDGPTWAGAL